MSDWTAHLEFEEGNSNKFWRARVEGKTLYVNYGKIGAAGQTQVKDFADPAAAKAEYDKLVREKRKKGYHDAGAAAGADDEGDDEDLDEDEDSGGDEDEDKKPARKPAAKAAAKAAAAAAVAPASAAGAPSASTTPGHRLALDAGGRKVETMLYLDGKTMRMDAREVYASPEAAKKAFDRLKKLLAGEGYKEG
jgi:predicted DNA-binding WGR domain protein